MCERFDLGLLLVFTRLDGGPLALFELLARQELSLAVASDLVELSDKFGVFEVKEILICALRIKVVLVAGIVVEVGVEKVSLVVFRHIQVICDYFYIKIDCFSLNN